MSKATHYQFWLFLTLFRTVFCIPNLTWTFENNLNFYEYNGLLAYFGTTKKYYLMAFTLPNITHTRNIASFDPSNNDSWIITNDTFPYQFTIENDGYIVVNNTAYIFNPPKFENLKFLIFYKLIKC